MSDDLNLGFEFKPPGRNSSTYYLYGEKYYSLRKASKILKMSASHVQYKVRHGKIYYHLINNRVFIPEWAIAVYEAERKKKNYIDGWLIGIEGESTGFWLWKAEDLAEYLKHNLKNDEKITITRKSYTLHKFISNFFCEMLYGAITEPGNYTAEFLVMPPFYGRKRPSHETIISLGGDFIRREVAISNSFLHEIKQDVFVRDHEGQVNYYGCCSSEEWVKFKTAFLGDPESAIKKFDWDEIRE